MNSTRPQSAKVGVSQFHEDMDKHQLNQFAVMSSANFKEVLLGVDENDRPEWIQDIIESDPPSEAQLLRAGSKILFYNKCIAKRCHLESNLGGHKHVVTLGNMMLSVDRAEAFKRRSRTLRDAFIAGSILVTYSADTPKGYELSFISIFKSACKA